MIWTTRPRYKLSEGLTAWRSGSGLPLVLLHGVGLNADAWGGQAEALAEQFELIAIDMPGHGSSSLLDRATELKDYSACIAAAIATLDEPVLLAGHSMGAMIALDIAARQPEQVLAVCALNAVYQRSAAAAEAVRARAAAFPADRNPDPTKTLQRWFGESLEQAEAQACRHWLETVNPEGYRSAYRVFANAEGPSEADLRQLPMPALFFTGEAEPNSTAAMSETMAALAPQGQVVVLPGAAHMMPMTHAAQVNQHLLSFFQFALELVDDGEL